MTQTKRPLPFFCLFFLCTALTLGKTPPEDNGHLDSDWEHRVYLATYPRSGNHWMRYLIEEATGIATSSIYRDNDPPHMTHVFPWGGYCCRNGYEGTRSYPAKGGIAVVKTHYPYSSSPFETLPYCRALRIVRHPIDSFYSFFVYENKRRQNARCKTIPRDTLNRYIELWERFQKIWDEAENVHTIRYEDLLESPFDCLKEALLFIGYHVSDDDIIRAVIKYPPAGYALKHRSRYKKNDLKLIETRLGPLMESFGYRIDCVRPWNKPLGLFSSASVQAAKTDASLLYRRNDSSSSVTTIRN